MSAMRYLFAFRGRVSRAGMWLFVPVGIAWIVGVRAIAAAGLHLGQLPALAERHGGHASIVTAALDGGPMGIAALGLIGVLLAGFVYAWFAVMAKRLHDRNRSAYWLILLFVATFVSPSVQVLVWTNPGMSDRFGLVTGTLLPLAMLVVTLWAFVELYCLPGTKGENRFGPDPRGRAPSPAGVSSS